VAPLAPLFFRAARPAPFGAAFCPLRELADIYLVADRMTPAPAT